MLVILPFLAFTVSMRMNYSNALRKSLGKYVFRYHCTVNFFPLSIILYRVVKEINLLTSQFTHVELYYDRVIIFADKLRKISTISLPISLKLMFWKVINFRRFCWIALINSYTCDYCLPSNKACCKKLHCKLTYKYS